MESTNKDIDPEITTAVTDVTFFKQKKFLCFTLKSYFAHENYEEIYTRFRQAVNGIEGYIGPEKTQTLGRHQLLIISFSNEASRNSIINTNIANIKAPFFVYNKDEIERVLALQNQELENRAIYVTDVPKYLT
ncbi:unnamed protein product [Rhizophagus irregularis]|uniref:Uncharacterized protein n=1 Tax=Rhizophagus irregularis TaxID=588596 RepID=A0A2I1H2K0_9GLOM|nr:hypothetical protein RhiirA4_471129 [Rhizophagus irregularis]CAB4430634.1 unnamed protein product [Rhizophagus irregularis]